ncbi:12073_t:CDS:1, partial [Gigaspora margarita]
METDPEAEITIIEIETTIIEIEAVYKIETTEMTEMIIAPEVMIDLLTLHRDPLTIPPYLTIKMLIILMELPLMLL